MKNLPEIFLSIISIVLVLVTSCVEERAGMEQPSGNLPSLDVQVAAMESSLAEIKSVIADEPEPMYPVGTTILFIFIIFSFFKSFRTLFHKEDLESLKHNAKIKQE